MFQAVKSRVSYLLKRPVREIISKLLNPSSIVSRYQASLYPPCRLYVRQDYGTNVINVFDGDGVKIWTIESSGMLSKDFIIYTGTRDQVARIQLGAFSRKVEFFSCPSIESAHFQRDFYCLGMFNCRFNLNDGTSFVWTKVSRSLEQVTYTSDNKEIRKRIARAKLLRKWHFDWEISYDISIEPLIILATAFMPMYSQWDRATSSAIYVPNIRNHGTTHMQHHHSLSSNIHQKARPVGAFRGNHSNRYESYGKHLIYEPDTTNLSFFNPPVGYQFA